MSSAEIVGLRNTSVEEIKRRGLLYHAAGHGWTCEPFGIPGETWDRFEGEITDEQKSWMAEVNGVRDLWHGVTLNTNMCYSNPVVRGKMVSAIADYARNNPAVDCLHVWLADGSNNQCECPECVKKMPSEWYVVLLNEIDEALTAAGLKTRVVFLIYVDLLWAPIHEKLKNPDRFILMFAPITRSYSQSLADAPYFEENKLPAFSLNHLKFPSDVGENLAWLRKWQKDFPGDSFDFDYHFMWDHFKDPGYYRMAETLFRDAQNLHKVGINGLVSCQCQRTFFPSGLGMHAMAAGLWSEDAAFEDTADRYFDAAFGEQGEAAQEYLRRLSDAFDPRYLRREVPTVDESAAKRFAGIPALVEEYRELIRTNAADTSLSTAVRKSWEYLMLHGELCLLMARALELAARGDADKASAVAEDACAWARLHEREISGVFDVYEFQNVFRGFFLAIKK